MLWLVLTLTGATFAADNEPLAKGIQDNSFLVEEAYNQEEGVVQHIINVPIGFTNGSAEAIPNFTQEWPFFGQTHQLSYTAAYDFEEHQNGFGDVRLNYRLQALMETDRWPAFAPRMTLVIPTGDEHKGLGIGGVGYETNLPFSKIVSDRWTVHFNAGMSFFPDVHGHDLTNYNLGASAIYAVSRDFNLMLETVSGWGERIEFSGHGSITNHMTNVLISPGARYAFNCPNDLQIVVGAAVPIGLTSDSPDWGLFLYLSFEHPFYRPRK